MRLFVGIELAGPARDAILSAREKLVTAIDRQGVRFVRPEKLHITLAFLGNVSESDVDPLKAALGQIEATPFHLTVDGLGGFPDMRRPKVIWIGLGGETDAIAALAARIVAATKPFAPELDEKSFSAHITLARVKPGSKEIGRVVQSMNLPTSSEDIPVDSFVLFHSKPDGTYEALASFGVR